MIGHSPQVLVIRINEPETSCGICGENTTGLHLAIPMFEDLVLPNMWQGDWVGVDACLPCFEKQERLRAPVPGHIVKVLRDYGK